MERLRDFRYLLLSRPGMAAVLVAASLALCWFGGGAALIGDQEFVTALRKGDTVGARQVLGSAHDWRGILRRLDVFADPRLYQLALDAQFEYSRHDAIVWTVLRPYSATVESVKGLIARGARPTYKHLAVAADDDNLPVALFLLQHGVPARGPRGERSALEAAARNGNARLALALIEGGVDVNALGGVQGASDLSRDPYWRPVYIAASYGHEDVVRVFLDHGADPLLSQGDSGTVWDALRKEETDRRNGWGQGTNALAIFEPSYRQIKAAVEKRLGHSVAD